MADQSPADPFPLARAAKAFQTLGTGKADGFRHQATFAHPCLSLYADHLTVVLQDQLNLVGDGCQLGFSPDHR